MTLVQLKHLLYDRTELQHTQMLISSKQSQHIAYSDVVKKPYADWMFVSFLGKKRKTEVQVIHNTESRDWIEQNTNPI